MQQDDLLLEIVSVPTTIEELRDLLAKVRRGARLLLEDDGKLSAGLLTPREMRIFLAEEVRRREAFRVLDEFAAPFADVPEEEIELLVAKAVAETCAEIRRENA